MFAVAALISDAPADGALDLWCRFDCAHYLEIAEVGYASQFAPDMERVGGLWVFFPLYPLLVGALSIGGGGGVALSALAVGLMISNIAFLGALILFHLFLRRELDSSQADRGVFLLAFIPVSFYFSSAYAESLFLFLLLAVFVFCQRKRWLAAGIAAALLSATRGVGVFVVFPMLLYLLRERGFLSAALHFRPPMPAALVGLSLAPLGLFAYMAYLHFHLGDAMAFVHAQALWYREPNFPWKAFFDFIDFERGWAALKDPLYTAIALILTAVAAARGRYEVALFALLQIALPLIYGYQSYPRYMMVTFALPMGALMLASGRALPVWIAAAILAALNFYWVLLWFEGHGLLV